MDLTLVCCSITIHIDRDIIPIIVLLSKSYSSADWYMSSHYAITPKEALAKHVHRASFAVGYAILSSK
jgi:hypothetical protein